MNSLPVTVGLDYSQDPVRICVMDQQGKQLLNRDLPNSAEAIIAAAERLGPVRGVAIEACCGATDLAEELVERAGWNVHLAHPGFVSRMKQNPDKHDYGDARILADLERVGYLPRVWIAPKALRELRVLVRDRQALVQQQRNLKLQIGALLRENRQRCAHSRWTKRWRQWIAQEAQLGEQSRWVMEQRLRRLTWVEGEIKHVEVRLAAVTQDDRLVQWLKSVRGIGAITAWTLRAEIGRFDRFQTGKQLARYCGLSPRNASSGQRQADAGLIKAANPQLRSCLIEAAWSLIQHDPRWRQLAQQLRARGKAGSVVSAAIGNRFMRWLWHQAVRVETGVATGVEAGAVTITAG
jgi:transposase